MIAHVIGLKPEGGQNSGSSLTNDRRASHAQIFFRPEFWIAMRQGFPGRSITWEQSREQIGDLFSDGGGGLKSIEPSFRDRRLVSKIRARNWENFFLSCCVR